MKRLPLLIALQFLSRFASGLDVTIIESQSINSGHQMDINWESVIAGMGHTPTIAPQTTLDNISFLSGTDILIVSSGVIDLPANRINTIIQFLQSGRPVYIQSEYLPTYTTNQAFEFIITSFGGSFSWTTLFSGDLQPMNVLGTFSTTNNPVSSLGYYWYSVAGQGDCNTINYLEYGGANHGFHYIPSNPSFGTINTNTDQDWINSMTANSTELMENIITHLISPPSISNGFSLNIGNDTTLCQGQTLTLDATTPNATYLWQNNSTNPVFTVTQQGTYWVRVTVNGCSATDTVHVTYGSLPVVDLGSNMTLCQGETLTLDATTANATYLWQDNSTNPTFTVVQSGTYQVEVTNACGTATDAVTVTFNPIPVVDLGKDTTLCEGATMTLDATTANATYLWQDNSTNPTFDVVQAGTYQVEVTNNCGTATDAVTVNFNPLPVVDLGKDTALCAGEVITLYATTTNVTYLWQDNSTNPTFDVAQQGTYWVEVANNCGTKADTVNVNYAPVPVVDLGNDTTLCRGITLTLDATTANATYLWQDNSTNPLFDVVQQGTYWVEVTNKCGTDSDTLSVELADCDCFLFIPNVFSPNADFPNNEFSSNFNCSFTEYNCMIFNRWGEKIFETNNPDDSWDGNYRGKMSPPGVYVYMVTYTFTGQNKTIKSGSVTLIR